MRCCPNVSGPLAASTRTRHNAALERAAAAPGARLGGRAECWGGGLGGPGTPAAPQHLSRWGVVAGLGAKGPAAAQQSRRRSKGRRRSHRLAARRRSSASSLLRCTGAGSTEEEVIEEQHHQEEVAEEEAEEWALGQREHHEHEGFEALPWPPVAADPLPNSGRHNGGNSSAAPVRFYSAASGREGGGQAGGGGAAAGGKKEADKPAWERAEVLWEAEEPQPSRGRPGGEERDPFQGAQWEWRDGRVACGTQCRAWGGMAGAADVASCMRY